ncbi:MAG: DNA starvation/stationary phase protection protein [Rothia sp. (in: high G+C Gram-positive bacteria)]|uniref:Dps family protein n=1 Tax=Rothia sp. (in: high G+C Gram-positive bacteria) TaxID=1885016 RepID=UPI0026DF92B1|nr:DNA starvation/stationary phase protection protein [Rothia sp. (in: high G+C Gram-positive bacteria)]MDO5749832.1 DNA starvation/stationary phase protection protein [Rothia sp. (in: high G+C Gram-positive bacteria)]
MAYAKYTAPGLSLEEGKELSEVLQARLHDLNDLHLLLKHAHWNVIGPGFIAVHEMIDPQVDTVREFVDTIAERMATLGASPNGLAGALVAARSVEDYAVGRARVTTHLKALNEVYTRVIEAHRAAIEAVSGKDPVTEDIFIGQTAELEKFQWFIRAFLENGEGEIA